MMITIMIDIINATNGSQYPIERKVCINKSYHDRKLTTRYRDEFNDRFPRPKLINITVFFWGASTHN